MRQFLIRISAKVGQDGALIGDFVMFYFVQSYTPKHILFELRLVGLLCYWKLIVTFKLSIVKNDKNILPSVLKSKLFSAMDQQVQNG